MKRVLTIVVCIMLLSVTAIAHSGRTDSDGGHYDNINGGYHYHTEGEHIEDTVEEQDVGVGTQIACGVVAGLMVFGAFAQTKRRKR